MPHWAYLKGLITCRIEGLGGGWPHAMPPPKNNSHVVTLPGSCANPGLPLVEAHPAAHATVPFGFVGGVGPQRARGTVPRKPAASHLFAQ